MNEKEQLAFDQWDTLRAVDTNAPLWDGDLPSKDAATAMDGLGLIVRAQGFSVITPVGKCYLGMALFHHKQKGTGPFRYPVADPAPAPDERVYVSSPEGLRSAPRIDDWGNIVSEATKMVEVRLDEPVGGFSNWGVLRAACHREGPQGDPPAEGAVFLGRIEHPDHFQGISDFWWWTGAIYRRGESGFARFSPSSINRVGCLSPDVRGAYLDALASARELGLVDIRVRDKLLEEAEPERPEQQYVVGQVVEDGANHVATIRQPRFCRDPRLLPVMSYPKRWQYLCAWHEAEKYGSSWENECALHRHTMTIADVPDETLLAIMRGKPVRVVDVPVTDEGLPYSDKLGSCEPDWLQRGKVVTVTGVGDIDEPGAVIEQKDGDPLWPWNLVPATDA